MINYQNKPLSIREIFKSIYFAVAPKGSKLYSLTHTIIRQLLNARYKYWIKHFDRFNRDDIQCITENIAKLHYKPLISVIMPVYNPNLDFLNQAIQSVLDQVYPHWELCIADDASTLPGIREEIEKYSNADHRIKAVFRTSNGHISAASNSALSLATGSYVALLDHDDMLHPLALYLVTKEINAHPESAVVYTDEDKITPKGKRIDPYFKSDFDHELFLSQNMVSHLGVYQRELINNIGGFRQGVEGSQDYDLLLRLLPGIDKAQIRHIPKVLYHWRISEKSVADSIDIKPYALEAGKKALSDYLAVRNIQADVDTFENFGYKIKYAPPTPEPKVELIFINNSKLTEQFVSQCCTLVEQAQENYSFIEMSIFAPENTWKNVRESLHTRLPNLMMKISTLDENFANRLNQHIRESSAEFIVLIDSACSQTESGWLSSLISLAVQGGISCVSPKLVDKKGYIYSCGLILDVDFYAQRLFHKVSNAQLNHYFGWSSLHKGFSALPSECLVLNKTQFISVGGFDAELSDHTSRCIDLCLKMREKGLRNVVMPEIIMILDESKQWSGKQVADLVISDEKDKHILLQRYKPWFKDDPAFNPNLTLMKGKPAVSKAPRTFQLN